jgi:amidase
MRDQHHNRHYAKARDLARSLTAANDVALDDADLPVMATTPMKARLRPRPRCSREEYIERAPKMGANAGQFDIVSDPAMNIPCGISEGLPVGMVLVGRLGDYATVLRAADTGQRNLGADSRYSVACGEFTPGYRW